MIEYESETQELSPEATTAYELFMGMTIDEWLFFVNNVETGDVTLPQATADGFNHAFGQRGRGDDRNA